MLSISSKRNAIFTLLRGGRLNRVARYNATYERKTPVEHVLLRPGMYIGQTETTSLDTWIYNESLRKMEKVFVNYNPGLLKVFDEILVNAADNNQRDKTMTSIDISISRSADSRLSISVKNDGKGIPLVKHETEKIHVPELIFGHLLTGSNFNDTQSRLTGGSHGYGAKLTNIFSNRFGIEAYDSATGFRYMQEWTKNMSSVTIPVIDKIGTKVSNSYTKITFEPDLACFGLAETSGKASGIKENGALLDEIVQMFQRRAMDIAACVAPTKVNFQYERPSGPVSSIPDIGSFKEYVELFSARAAAPAAGGPTDSADPAQGASGAAEPSGQNYIAYANVNDRWEVAVGLSSTGNFENMSFVNNVWTVRGGTHVTLVTAQITKAIEQALAKKNATTTSAAIRNKMMVFVNCKIENPMFEGQTKGSLNSKPAVFGSTCKLSDAYLKEIIAKTGIVESLLEDIATKEHNRAMKRPKSPSSQVIDVAKLEDAHDAGGPRALDCTLILTEGDSAKALAVAGLEVVGRQTFGVMPLRGKVLNVRVATRSQALKNEEFVNLCKALGLDFKKSYEHGLQGEGLRYGKVMIMCDQDTDGSHIKGLVINLFHHFWPALLKHEGFLQQFITPIVKTTATKGKKKELKSFYSIPEFKQWQEARRAPRALDSSASAGERKDDVTIKYYKGLGTNTAAEGREYFQSLRMHRKNFQQLQDVDDAAIDLVFNKEKAADRKHWLSTQHDRQAYLNPHSTSVSYEEFIHKELIHFSHADIHRSIPNVIDGLKPSQRKVLYGCFKKNLIKEEAKVVQIAGYIAEHTAYHHGEAALHSTIINMAQDYVGSNNVPLLVASGQFGTRAQGGKDFASPRYVFTRLSPITRLLFPEEDDGFLSYEEEDGQRVEPTFFVPVVPALLLNGTQGIGTGWSTSVPTFHLPHVVDHVRHKLLGTTPAQPLTPHVMGFKGAIVPANPTNSSYRTTGIAKRQGATKLIISELPYGVWTDDYKQFLIDLTERGDIKSFKEFHATDSVHFEISSTKALLDAQEGDHFVSFFKLSSAISLNNMHAFDRHGKINKYHTAGDIVDAHFEVRHAAYATRKAALERIFAAEELRARNKSNFIAGILSGDISILTSRGAGTVAVSATDIVRTLHERGYSTEEDIRQVHDGTAAKPKKSKLEGSFEYLLDLPIHSLTDERIIKLRGHAQDAADKLAQMEARSVQDLWLADLDRVSSAYSRILKGKV